MLVYHCDICKKRILDKETAVFAGVENNFSAHCLCPDCGEPVLKFLQKNKLIADKKILKRK